MKLNKILRKAGSGLLLIAIPLTFLAVKCERPETVGPEYALAPEGFTVLNYSMGNPTANFASAKDTFYANFSHKVSWTITLTGANSGATKTITGTSDKIDGSDLSWLWDGSHEGLYFFRANEKVGAKITFLGSQISLVDSILITSTKTFKDIVVIDFETTPSWISYNDVPGGDNPSVAAVVTEGQPLSSYLVAGRTFAKSLQGTRAFYWYSKDAGNYFGGGGARGLSGAQRALLPTSADSLYFNVFIFGFGDANSKLNFGAREDDNNNGSHNPLNEDEFQVQITLDHVGWKLFSFKYNSMTPSASATNGGSGNKILEPKKITDITFGLISAPSGNFVETIIDFPVLTFGRPFDPSY